MFYLLRIEEEAFAWLAMIVAVAFVVHYWLPFRLKERVWVGISVAGAFVLLDALSATLLLSLGLAIFGLLASPLPFRLRVGAIGLMGAGLVYGRATNPWGVPIQFWAVAGSLFMFRLVVYLYDLRHGKHAPTLYEFLAYFYPIPNYYFLLFPVVDYQTMRRTYYQRDIHEIAQQGLGWMVRGTLQLALYRAIYHLKPPFTPDYVTSFGQLVLGMLATYLLYLRVSGQFHLVIGMLHLFGYDLPETHRKYLLAHSLTDFWRRINIYWKDFMVKIVYFPLYFRLRKRGEVSAQIAATSLVFVATWFLHSYQWFWLRGEMLFSVPDTLFWATLGLFVVINVLWEQRRKGRRQIRRGWQGHLVHGLQVAATLCLITTLWSLWNAPSLSEWVDVLTWWQIG